MRSTRVVLAVVLVAVAAGCGDGGDRVATAAGGGTTVPGERADEPATTSSSSAPPDVDEPTETDVTALTARCLEVSEGVGALGEPETVGDVRALMREAIGLHDAWLADARQSAPPGIPAGEWTTHLDRAEVAVREAESYIAGLTAGLSDSEPAATLYEELTSPEGTEVDADLNDALRAINELLGEDCFEVPAPEG